MRIARSVLVALVVSGVACGGPKQPPPAGTGAPAAAKPKAGIQVEVVAAASGQTVEGVARDVVTGELLAGVTMVVTSPALSGSQTAISDEAGRFVLTSLPPGSYTIAAYYGDKTIETKFELGTNKLAKATVLIDTKADTGMLQISEQPPSFKDWNDALMKGHLEETYRLGELELNKQPSSKLHGVLAISRWGAGVERWFFSAMRREDDGARSVQMRKATTDLLANLDQVQAHLEAAAKDPKFALELCVACIGADGEFSMLIRPGVLDIERDRAGKELPEGDPRRRPTYRFDHGDLAWGRAMVSFQQAFLNIALAYDWSWIDMVDAPPDGYVDPKITVKLAEPARIAKAREQLLAAIAFSDESRKAFLAETDDDREWVPNPKQKSYASPLAVDAKLYQTWESMLGDVRSLITGDTGISIAALWAVFGQKTGAPAGFIDIGAMLKTPKDMVWEIGSLEKIEGEKNPAKQKQLATTILKSLLGDGYKATMKKSPITDRLMQLRKDLDQQGGEQLVEDKLKYLLWFN